MKSKEKALFIEGRLFYMRKEIPFLFLPDASF